MVESEKLNIVGIYFMGVYLHFLDSFVVIYAAHGCLTRVSSDMAHRDASKHVTMLL